MVNYKNTGMSVAEFSHRGKNFVQIAEAAEKDFRELMKVPKNYKIFFFQGGATMQYSAIPFNLLGEKKKANYFSTGLWSN